MGLTEYKTPLIAGGTFLVGVTLGAFAGAKFIEKRMADHFDQRLLQETELILGFRETLHKEKYATPEDAVKDLIPDSTVEMLKGVLNNGGRPAEQKVAYHKIGKDVDPEEEHAIEAEYGKEALEQFETVRKNVFAGGDDLLGDIRIISAEEYNENASDFIQNTLTYYKDDVLCDDHEEKIEDVTRTVGDALDHFGGISDDPNVVYVRNTILSLEFEIVKSASTYACDVLGLVDETPIVRPSARIRQQGG